jgi:hypothetical protein
MFWKNRWNVHTLYVDDRIAKMSVARAVGPSVKLLPNGLLLSKSVFEI